MKLVGVKGMQNKRNVGLALEYSFRALDNSGNPFLGSAVPDQTGNASQKTKQRDAVIALYLFRLTVV